ncbi:MAG: 4-hydroxy-tetrahydrodipicolinate reductase [candidate division WOR-3 bacterium]|nr:4-hydroxy-tetrahydrodipicolinate reductase [candidate division WOR-3 bacterium]
MRVVVAGCAGRMGGEVCRLIAEQTDMELVGGIEAKGHKAVGSKLGSGAVGTDLSAMIANADVVADFSNVEATVANCRLAAASGKAFISGVTGLSAVQMKELHDCARQIPVVYAPSFSVGVSVLCKLVAEAASRLGPDYDVEVIETHHRMKKDAPSGTAARLVDILKASTGRTGVVYGRQGAVGEKPKDEIGVSSIRTGSVVGEHTVVFGCTGERLELTHKAESRAAFATGVLAAVRFALGRAPGFYTIEDVLASPR